MKHSQYFPKVKTMHVWNESLMMDFVDAVVELPVIGVLWSSLAIANGKMLPPLKLRKFVTILLNRSIVLGSVKAINMHDIVR